MIKVVRIPGGEADIIINGNKMQIVSALACIMANILAESDDETVEILKQNFNYNLAQGVEHYNENTVVQ